MTSTSPVVRTFEIPPAERTERQAALVQRIEQGPRGRVPINLRAWLHNPDFADVVEQFGLYVSELAPITKRQKEIVVLVGAHFWDAQFELNVHSRFAKNVGITAEQIDAIAAGRDPRFTDPVESLTWELVHSLHTVRHVPDDLYARAMERFGHRGVQDLIGLTGLYTMIAMTLNFYDVPVPTRPPEAATQR